MRRLGKQTAEISLALAPPNAKRSSRSMESPQRLPDGGRRERLDLHPFSALCAMGFGAESGWQVQRVDRSAILSQPKMTEPRVVAQQRDHF